MLHVLKQTMLVFLGLSIVMLAGYASAQSPRRRQRHMDGQHD